MVITRCVFCVYVCVSACGIRDALYFFLRSQKADGQSQAQIVTFIIIVR